MHPAQLANRRINALHARTDSQKEATQNYAKNAIPMSLLKQINVSNVNHHWFLSGQGTRESVLHAKKDRSLKTKSVPNAIHPAQLAKRAISVLNARTDSLEEATQNCAKNAIPMSS